MLGDKRSMYEGTVLVIFVHWELIIVGLIIFFPFVLICSYHVPFFSVKQSQGFATCSTALFVQLPGSQLGVFPSNWGAFHGKTRSLQERAMCCVVENYQEEDGVRVPRLTSESKVNVKTNKGVM